MKTKLNQLSVSAIIPVIVTNSGTITIKDNVVTIITRKHGSTRMLTKTIPLSKVIAIEHDTQNKGTLTYVDEQGEINFKYPYELISSKTSGFVALKRIIDKKDSNKTLPTTLIVSDKYFTSVFEKGKEPEVKSGKEKKTKAEKNGSKKK